jgi:hypothetical protein
MPTPTLTIITVLVMLLMPTPTLTKIAHTLLQASIHLTMQLMATMTLKGQITKAKEAMK